MIMSRFFRHNLWATLFVNFKLLPLRQAIRFPIVIYHRFRMGKASGRLIIQSSHIHRGMIKFGSQGSEMFPISDETILYLQGDMICQGSLIVGVGTCVRVGRNATIVFGNGVILGAQNLLFCEERITFGDDFLSSWRCQIMDTDTHGLIDTQTGMKAPCKKEIFVGRHTWIVNSVFLYKGTCLPDDSIVASGSICNKDYSEEKPYCLFAGRPAKVVRRNTKWEV